MHADPLSVLNMLDVNVTNTFLPPPSSSDISPTHLFYSSQNDGNTSMHLAALEGNIDAFVDLLAHGADVTIKNLQGKTCFDLLKSKINSRFCPR